MPTQKCKIDKSTLLFIGGIFTHIRWPPNFELPYMLDDMWIIKLKIIGKNNG
jgi:hypothetical protein